MSLGNIHTNICKYKYQYKQVHPKIYMSHGNIHTRYANINININRFIPRYVCLSVICTLDMQI